MSARTRLGVLGWPVAHSRSPAMHNAALRVIGLVGWRYQLLPVPPDLFAETVRALSQAGFRGANVTIPHKQAARRLADHASPRAAAIGAANTLRFSSERGIEAENTDAPALIASLPFEASGRSALVLGAGGTARAAVWALLDAGAAEVRVWNRTAERARQLCDELGASAASAASAVAPADVLINCTVLGLQTTEVWPEELPLKPSDLEGYGCVVDFVYSSSAETALVQAARKRSIPTVDGLELLLAQGALSFELFTGAPAPAEAMRDAIVLRHDRH
ncbi:MAG: shikimate dehydrogenase [Solirubrobacterales bacterium]|nr:shikimate dehydrogenase [Solirubrobacterales bacterium]MBV9918483.1 shikimate dehydrogenase [Solirubrobacterales bacterium]